ncbi:hypothetical protein GTU35_001894 [Vibrio fluvialis]|nr:hypothetical protein [Vibrio fluvialis]ELI5735526.1 hypothetical protein [Vibrio fluvialis]
MTILVLTDQFDTHADLVCKKLLESKSKFYRLNLDTESLRSTEITFNKSSWLIRQANCELKSIDISKVWARRPFVEVTLEEESINDPSFKIWKGEWNRTLLGLYNSLKRVYWLNPLAKAYQAENKYLQMEIANEVGFKLPDTLVSNNKDTLCCFSEFHDEVVMKLMNQDFYEDKEGSFKGIYVNKITTQLLEDSFEVSGENPIVLQSYIPKAYEVRYTVVGDDHHVCQIQSQSSSKANVDWRRYDIPKTPHYKLTPPEHIKEKVNKLMTMLDLEFGALDFIVTPSDEWYFLEINTMGQWLWIEDLTGMKISDSIVNKLTMI